MTGPVCHRGEVWRGGAPTAGRRTFREQLRLQAAERFEQGEDNAVIAYELRVSIRSVQRWRMAWTHGGEPALTSKGPASLPRISDELFALLETELGKGAVAHGWPDQTLTLSRIKTLIGRRFHKSYTIQGVAPPVASARLELSGPGPPGGRA